MSLIGTLALFCAAQPSLADTQTVTFTAKVTAVVSVQGNGQALAQSLGVAIGNDISGSYIFDPAHPGGGDSTLGWYENITHPFKLALDSNVGRYDFQSDLNRITVWNHASFDEVDILSLGTVSNTLPSGISAPQINATWNDQTANALSGTSLVAPPQAPWTVKQIRLNSINDGNGNHFTVFAQITSYVANPATYRFTLTVTQVTADMAETFTVGQTGTLHVTYDPAATGTEVPNCVCSPQVLNYPDAVKHARLQIGGYGTESFAGQIAITNNASFGDLFNMHPSVPANAPTAGGKPLISIAVQLRDSTGAVFLDRSLPSSLSYSSFDVGVGSLNFRLPSESASTGIGFQITSVAKLDDQPPTALAGPDQSLLTYGTAVTLNGGASFDDNTPTDRLVYTWRTVSAPQAVALSGQNTATPAFVPSVPGNYVFELKVTDSAGLVSSPDVIVVSSANLPPAASAGSDAIVTTNQPVSFNGQGSSDPEGAELEYLWTIELQPAGSSVTMNGDTTWQVGFTPTHSGTYELKLQVTDPFGGLGVDTVRLVVLSTEEYIQQQVIEISGILETLVPAEGGGAGEINPGNRNAMVSMLERVVAASADADSPQVRSTLEKLIVRTDGCALRGAPDGSGPTRDWVLTCAAQAALYQPLVSALGSLP